VWSRSIYAGPASYLLAVRGAGYRQQAVSSSTSTLIHPLAPCIAPRPAGLTVPCQGADAAGALNAGNSVGVVSRRSDRNWPKLNIGNNNIGLSGNIGKHCSNA
jgi:hypothetical protein